MDQSVTNQSSLIIVAKQQQQQAEQMSSGRRGHPNDGGCGPRRCAGTGKWAEPAKRSQALAVRLTARQGANENAAAQSLSVCDTM